MAKIGIVMSGGLAKGAYQIGVLKAIDELVEKNQIVAISASSVGVLNSYAFLNKNLETAENIWLRMDFNSITKFIKTVLKGSFIDDCIASMPILQGTNETDFYATYLNTSSKKINYININRYPDELTRKFLRASVALPPFNKPVQILENNYLDGALVDNIPISPFLDIDLDCIICIYFDEYNYSFENERIDSKTIKINHQSDMFMKNVFSFKHEYIEKMIKSGYKYGRKVLQRFFDNGILIPNHYDAIEKFNDDNCEKYWYKTCEVVTKHLNDVAQKIFEKESLNEPK